MVAPGRSHGLSIQKALCLELHAVKRAWRKDIQISQEVTHPEGDPAMKGAKCVHMCWVTLWRQRAPAPP